MYHPHHFLSQIKQMNQRTSVPANDHGELRTMCNTETSKSDQLLCLQLEKLPLSAEHALEKVSFC